MLAIIAPGIQMSITAQRHSGFAVGGNGDNFIFHLGKWRTVIFAGVIHQIAAQIICHSDKGIAEEDFLGCDLISGLHAPAQLALAVGAPGPNIAVNIQRQGKVISCRYIPEAHSIQDRAGVIDMIRLIDPNRNRIFHIVNGLGGHIVGAVAQLAVSPGAPSPHLAIGA